MKQGFLQSSRYSPGNMSRESLEALFVGRDEIMENVLSRLMKSIQGPEKHYLLLVGPRGSGKTHFIALARHRLMERLSVADAHSEVLVAELNEEEWGVASFLDLVARILKALADQAPSLAAEIGTIYDKFSKDPDEAEAYAIAMLRQHTRGKTLILFCENLVDLFGGLGDEGQMKWRSAIQEDGNWTIVASTPSLFAALTLQDNPFYGFFTIRQLEKLEFEAALELLAKKAACESRPELASFLHTPLGRARARAIHHLAAGNHRAYVVLFDFLDKESLDELTKPFMQMVDDLTPYYQDRMRQLSPTQRKIVEFLSQQGIPTTIKDISVPSLMSQPTAAKQIGELESAGFVRRTKVGRNAFCELSEPLMRICIEIKDNKTQHFRLFVEFLRHWFTTSELERRQSACRNDHQITSLDRVHVEEALRCSYADRKMPFRDALLEEAQRCIEADDYDGLATIQETLANDGGEADDHGAWIFALIETGDLESAIEVGCHAAAKFPDQAAIHYLLARAYSIQSQFDEALNAIDRAIDLDEESPWHFRLRACILRDLERLDEALYAVDRAIDLDEGNPRHFWLRADILHDLDRLDEAFNAVDCAIDLDGESPAHFWLRACILQDLERLDEALYAVDRAIDLDKKTPRHFWLRAWILRDLERPDEALYAVDRAIGLDGEESGSLCLRADILLDLERFDEAIDTAQAVLNADPIHLPSHEQIIRALVSLDRVHEARARARELVEQAPGNLQALLVAIRFYLHHARLDETLQLLQRALEIDPENQEARVLRGHVLCLMSDFRRANEDLRFYASLHPRSIDAHRHLADSLLQSGEWEEAADVADRLIKIDPESSLAYYVRGIALAELNRPEDAVAAFDNLLSTEDCEGLLIAASTVRDIGDNASAKRYLGRVAELQPDNQNLWMETTRVHILEGSFDAATESAARIEALPGCSLLGRLFAAQAAAATRPLHLALDALGTAFQHEGFNSDDQLHVEAAAEILTISMRNFGPGFIPEGLVKLRSQLGSLADDGVLGRILTNFLHMNVDDGFTGSLPEWEKAFEDLFASLEDLSDCQIPLQMLRAALNYTKTGDERHLLSLPLEQRQLLEGVY